MVIFNNKLGFGVHAVCNLEKKFDYMNHIDYCGITIIRHTMIEEKSKPKTKTELVIKNFTGHLK